MPKRTIILLFFIIVSFAIHAQNDSIKELQNYVKKTILELNYGENSDNVGIVRVAGGNGASSFAIYDNKIFIMDNVNARILVFQKNKLYRTINNVTAIDILINKRGKLFALNNLEEYIDVYSDYKLAFHLKIPISHGNLINLSIDKNNNVYFRELFTKNNAVYIVDSNIIKSSKPITDLLNYSISTDRKKGSATITHNINKKSIEFKQPGKNVGIEYIGEDENLNSYFRIGFDGLTAEGKIKVDFEIRKYNNNLNLLSIIKLKTYSAAPYDIKRNLLIDKEGNIYYMEALEDKLVIYKWNIK